MRRWLPILAGIVLLSTVADADELHLKDGSVVTGTVVGYEQDSFRVKTSWGYAEIRKEQVAQIVIGGSTSEGSNDAKSSAEKKSTSAKKPNQTPAQITPVTPPAPPQNSTGEPAAQPPKGQLLVRAVVPSPNTTAPAGENSAAAKLAAETLARSPANPRPASASTRAPAVADKLLVSASTSTTVPGSAPENITAVATTKRATPKISATPTNATGPPSSQPGSAPQTASLGANPPSPHSSSAVAASTDEKPSPAPPALKAAKPPTPKAVRESVSGNEYINQTYGFRMYRPPDWQLDAAARKMMPGSVAALATSDESTYFFIGLEPAHGTLPENLVDADKRLRGIMENYRVISDRQVTISGAPATERRFRGSVDGKEWSGVLAVLPRTSQLYTVFGITQSSSDLAGQIQENVIRKSIDSLTFTK
jgi:hypothetical protein